MTSAIQMSFQVKAAPKASLTRNDRKTGFFSGLAPFSSASGNRPAIFPKNHQSRPGFFSLLLIWRVFALSPWHENWHVRWHNNSANRFKHNSLTINMYESIMKTINPCQNIEKRHVNLANHRTATGHRHPPKPKPNPGTQSSLHPVLSKGSCLRHRRQHPMSHLRFSSLRIRHLSKQIQRNTRSA